MLHATELPVFFEFALGCICFGLAHMVDGPELPVFFEFTHVGCFFAYMLWTCTHVGC